VVICDTRLRLERRTPNITGIWRSTVMDFTRRAVSYMSIHSEEAGQTASNSGAASGFNVSAMSSEPRYFIVHSGVARRAEFCTSGSSTWFSEPDRIANSGPDGSHAASAASRRRIAPECASRAKGLM